MLRQLWTQSGAGLEPRIADRLGTNLLDLIVTALCARQAAVPSGGSLANAQRLRVRYFVEDHLTEPGLDASLAAAAVHISTRYVHRLFEASGETFGQYVLRRRLEESARRLRDPAHDSRSVTEIAFDCGFTDASYFGRMFRAGYGRTPGDFRRADSD